MRGPVVFVSVVLFIVALIPVVPVSAQQNCVSLEPSVRAMLEPWLAKGTGLFENPFATRFDWCFIISRKDWTGDGKPDILFFRALRSFDKRADVWVTAWLPLRGNAAPVVVRFAHDEALSKVSYRGFTWRDDHAGWGAFYSDTILRGFGGTMFVPDMRSRPDTVILDWLMQNFGISSSRAISVLPEYFWRDGRFFVVRYLP